MSDYVCLREQKALYASRAPHMRPEVHRIVDEYWDDIVSLGRSRHIAGYTEYQDHMYHVTEGDRLIEILEELADVVVYLTSGDLP